MYLRHQTGEKYIHAGDEFLGANGEIVGEAAGATIAKTDANGRLQAAAPELLFACESALSELREVQRIDGEAMSTARVIKQIEDAIDTATAKAIK